MTIQEIENELKKLKRKLCCSAASSTARFGVPGEDDAATQDRSFALHGENSYFIVDSAINIDSYFGMYSNGEFEVLEGDPNDGDTFTGMYMSPNEWDIYIGSNSVINYDGLQSGVASNILALDSSNNLVLASNVSKEFHVGNTRETNSAAGISNNSATMKFNITGKQVVEFDMFMNFAVGDGTLVTGFNYTGTLWPHDSTFAQEQRAIRIVLEFYDPSGVVLTKTLDDTNYNTDVDWSLEPGYTASQYVVVRAKGTICSHTSGLFSLKYGNQSGFSGRAVLMPYSNGHYSVITTRVNDNG